MPRNAMPSKRNELLSLLSTFDEMRRSYEGRLWDTLKYFTTLITALLSVSGGMVALALTQGKPIGIVKIASVIPILGIVLAILGYVNLQREYRRTMEIQAIIKKLEYALGLHDKSFLGNLPSQSRTFMKDETLFPDRWLKDDTSTKSSDDWIESKMSVWHNLKRKGKATFFAVFSILFWILIVLNVVMLVIVLLV